MPLSDADREFLSNQWRWATTTDDTLRTRHPGAREAEYGSAFITLAGATIALNIIAARLMNDRVLLTCMVDRLLDLSFKQRPPTVRIHHSRFGHTLSPGKLMLCERAEVDHGNGRTTLYLTG